MREWSQRPEEIRALLNPAFCGRVLYATVFEYQIKTDRGLPFPLVYLVLPLVLPNQIRNRISSKTNLTNWVNNNGDVLYNFGKQANDLLVITNEALELMLQIGVISVNSEGELEINHTKKKLSKTKFTNSEIKECLNKAEHVARWFASTGKVDTIYCCLGVRP